MLSSEKLTLFELNQRVKGVLSEAFQSNFWVVAEISEIKENSSGHCYLELIQKDDQQDYPKAKARATIWAYTYRMLKPYFETTTGRSLSSGLKVLIQVEIVFHEVFGYSLNIVDIEPSYTLGDIEQKRREAIEKLIADGVFDMNKGLQIPLLPKSIAIISSSSAAGLQDFINQIETNPYGYRIDYTLFPSIMQGDNAENSIISALNQIYDQQDRFDVVAIIRGGGSQADLSCFDSYWLAAHVAQFPLPIATGIGHEKDISVVDLVAHTKLKTPTAVAEFLIGKFIEAESTANELKDRLEFLLEEIISEQEHQLGKYITFLAPSLLQQVSNEKILIDRIRNKLSHYALMQIGGSSNRVLMLKDSFQKSSKNYLEKQLNYIELKSNTANSLDPINVLKRGYSITLHENKILSNSLNVSKGDSIRTIFKDGEISSIVT